MFHIIEIFSTWCKQKIILHTAAPRPQKFFKQNEVWWCAIGMNIGDEIFGKGDGFYRPVFILKKLTATTFLGLPITMRGKTGTWYVQFQLRGQQRWVPLNQARMFDTRRLLSRIGSVTTDDTQCIRNRFVAFYRS